MPLALSILLLAACAAEPAPPEHVTPDEALRLRAALAVLGAEQATATCPRAVLRGRAEPGSGEAAVAAVAEGRDAAQCLALVAEQRTALDDALFVPFEDLPTAWPHRNPWQTLRTITRGQPAPNVVERVAAACAPLVEQLHAAVAHQDVCSPYRPGIAREEPRRLPDVALAITATAVQRWIAEDDPAAARALLDGLRLMDDVERGGARIEAQVLAVRARTPLVAGLEGLLDRAEPLGASLARSIEAEVATLVASHPPMADSLRGLWASLLLDLPLPRRGGDDALLPFVGLHLIAGLVQTVCSAEAPVQRCADELSQVDGRLAELTRLDGRNGALAESMVSFVGPYPQHVRQRALRDAALPGLRTAATWRRVIEETGECPSGDAFDAQPLRSARRDPVKDGILAVTRFPAGRYLVHIEGWPDGPDLEDAPPGVVLSCPVTRILALDDDGD